MRASNPSPYTQPSRYSLVDNSEKEFEAKPAAHASWVSQPQTSRPNGSYISAEHLNRQSESYMIIPASTLHHNPDAKKNKTGGKYKIFLLLVRICCWLGAAGLLICVVLVRPIGSTMDWVIRAPVSLNGRRSCQY